MSGMRKSHWLATVSIVALAGVTPAAVYTWRRDFDDFPEPIETTVNPRNTWMKRITASVIAARFNEGCGGSMVINTTSVSTGDSAGTGTYVITAPEAGTTRDAIRVEWQWRGRKIRLIDTAGMRRQSRIDHRLEQMSVADTLDSIRTADVVVVVLDAGDMAEKQDLTIAGRVIDEGRALVIAVNKTDLLADDRSGASKAWRKLSDRLEASFAQVKDVPIVGFSALSGRGVEKLMPAVFEIDRIWNKRVPTPKLNRWLREMETLHPPPLAKGRRIRLRFMSQVKTRPPTFVLSASQADELGKDYIRFLVNRLRDDFGMPGVPIRLSMRKAKNPFAGRAKKQR